VATGCVVFWVNIRNIEERDPEEGCSRFLRKLVIVFDWTVLRKRQNEQLEYVILGFKLLLIRCEI
jgi:hypothetical protein